MQRTLNYTNRRKIEKKEALFSFVDDAAETPEFNVLLNLDTALYPDNASVYIEAYYKETRQRFDFGTVIKVAPPQKRILDKLDLSGTILFRILIVDESGKHGLLLASGEGFRADADNDDENKSSILTVKTRPLGQVIWTLDIETDGMPELILNASIPNAMEKMRSDTVFQALILPAALKQVLTYYLWNEDENDSCRYWMAFAEMFADKKPDGEDPADLVRWVDEIVENFSARFSFCDMLTKSIREEEE